MIGYWDAESGGPLANVPDGPIDIDGWLRSGDVGRIENGLLYVTGRCKDIVIRGGENVAAAHVEAVLVAHPDVLVAAVVGLPDPDLGDRVAAAVQLVSGSATTTEQLAAFARDRLARFEIPSDWQLSSQPLPITDVGKIDKAALRVGWPTAITE